MPSFETMDLYQRAILWPKIQGPSGVDRYGQPLIGSPVEIPVRWNDVIREALDPNGNTITIAAEVVVAQDIPIASVMWKGKLTDLPGTALMPESDVMLVFTFNNTLDIKGRITRKTVSLMRYRNTLPA